jgi:uncharacterized membrane protein
MIYFKKNLDKVSLGIIIFLAIVIYSFIGIQKHLHFQTFGWDTAIFDQQVYLVSQLKVPYSSLHGFMGLGDHFHPLLYLVGGLAYKIWSNAGMLYVLQSMIACLSAIPLFLINKYLLEKTKFSKIQKLVLNLLLVVMYLSSVNFQFMVIGEYNDAPTVVLPLLFTLYFLLVKNSLGYWISFVLILLIKEEYCLLSIPLSIYIALSLRDFKKSLVTLVLGMGSFFLLTYHVMPAISGTNEYIFFSESNKPENIIWQMFTHPWEFVTKLLDNPEKRKTIFISLFSFGFLPLLSILNLILPGFNLAVRFYDSTILRRYEFNNQYASGLVGPMAVAGSFGLVSLINFLQNKKFKLKHIFWGLVIYLVGIILVQDLVFHGPVNSLFKPSFYEFSISQKDAHELIAVVPKDVTIAANNSLLPHLSQRENFYLLPKVEDAEYIAVDLSDGPNKFAPLGSSDEMKRVINQLVRDNHYQIVWMNSESMLLKRLMSK